MASISKYVHRRAAWSLKRAAASITSEYLYIAANAVGVSFGVWIERTYPNFARPWQYGLAIWAAGTLYLLIGELLEKRSRAWKPKTWKEQAQAQGIADHGHGQLDHRHPFNDPAHDHGFKLSSGVFDYERDK